VDGHGQTVDFYLSETRDREAAKRFLKKALANPDNRPPSIFARNGLRNYLTRLRLRPTRCISALREHRA
jgi:transposase-like protein